MMLAGRVTVNGTVVTQMGVRIDPSSDKVSVDGEPIRSSPVRWVAFYKPAGVLTTRADPHGGVTIYDWSRPNCLYFSMWVGWIRMRRDFSC